MAVCLRPGLVTPVKLVLIGVRFEVAIGQEAIDGSLAGLVSISAGTSSAIASICR
jgi:hypothetical protein